MTICRRLIAAFIGICILTLGAGGFAQEPAETGGLFAFNVPEINPGLAALDSPGRRDTPRATLAFFFDAVDQDNFARAGHALNLNAIPEGEQAEQATELALKLAFLLRRHGLINWSEIPDRPDARVIPGLGNQSSPYQRRSIDLGEMEMNGRPVVIRLQRFKPSEGEAVWLFSPSTVTNIPAMYERSQPGLLARLLPIQQRLDTLGRASGWEWLAAAIILLLATAVWWLVYGLISLLARISSRRAGPALKATRVPLATALATFGFYIGLTDQLVLTGPLISYLDTVSEVVALIAGAWLLLRLASKATLALTERYVVPLAPDDPENRRRKTAAFVARRSVVVIIALVSFGYVLLKTSLFENFGLSVLASVGALGILVAVAARPLLENMVAGFQIVLTDLLRVGDILEYEGRWATVEDIGFAYIVMRTWTNTDLIVPHAHILSNAFENWSKNGDTVRRIVKIPVDYRVDVTAIREKVHELIEGDPRSTGEAPSVEVVEFNDDTAVLWIWISGTDAMASWHLHNYVREKLLDYLKNLEGGRFLPRQRYELLNDAEGATQSAET